MTIILFSAFVVIPFYWLCLCNNIMWFLAFVSMIRGLCCSSSRTISLFSQKVQPSHDCCGWIWVSYDMKGHVTGLDLNGESISGGFQDSSVLFTLQHLQKLNFPDINFNSIIPFGFNKLNKLTLNFSHADLAGQVPILVLFFFNRPIVKT